MYEKGILESNNFQVKYFLFNLISSPEFHSGYSCFLAEFRKRCSLYKYSHIGVSEARGAKENICSVASFNEEVVF